MLLARMTTGLLAGLLLLTLSGCPKDPYDPDTWIEKLDDPAEFEGAVNRLADLKDPKAIAPLGNVWRKHSRSSRVLRIIIALADRPADKGGPVWKDAVPILIEALQFEMGNVRSIEDAMTAADALGRAGDPAAVQALISAINTSHAGNPLPITDPGQNVRVAAMRALGNFGKDPRAIETLVRVLQTDPLTDDQRDNPAAMLAAAKIRGAAANALGATKNPEALGPLVLALYQVDIIFPQVRGALTQLGGVAIPELLKVFKGEHAEVNKFAKENNFANDCSKGEGPGTTCVAPGAIAYKSAMVLGDLRATEAVPTLIESLKKPARTSFFGGNGVPGPPDHNGVLDALRKIGDAKAADVVASYMQDAKTDDVFVRPLAIDVYSMIARDGKAGMDYLAKEMKNDEQEVEQIRQAAGMAYARLVTSKDQLGPLDTMIERYSKKSAEEAAKAAKSKSEEDKETAMSNAAGYRDFATLFWQHKVRALVGVTCKSDIKCYAGFLTSNPEKVITELKVAAPAKLSPDEGETMTKALRAAFLTAAQERALLEIAKAGDKAADTLPTLLQLAPTTERLLREGVLLAMVRVAPEPCPQCTEALDKVLAEQENQDRLSFLSADTRVVRNYFASAEGGTPKAAPAAAAKPAGK